MLLTGLTVILPPPHPLRRNVLILIRSILFNILFYLNLAVLLVLAMPTLLLPRRAVIGMAKIWARSSLWLLRVVCGTKVDFRGTSKIPSGPLIVAAKHHSIWETFALLPLFDDPVFIIKRELMFIPLFGWCAWKGGMISVDRSKGGEALVDMTIRARDVIRGGRQLIIFPEGTRRPAGGRAAIQVRRQLISTVRSACRACRWPELRALLGTPILRAPAGDDPRRMPRSDSARCESRRFLYSNAARYRDRDRTAARRGPPRYRGT